MNVYKSLEKTLIKGITEVFIFIEDNKTTFTCNSGDDGGFFELFE